MNVQDFTPSITFFNFSGDITITWTADQEENILRDGRAFKELARVSLAQPPTKSFTLLLSV